MSVVARYSKAMKHRLFLSILILLFGLSTKQYIPSTASGTKIKILPETQTSQDKKPQLRSLSPYDIKSYVWDIKLESMRNNGSELDISELWRRLEIKSDVFNSCTGYCDAETHSVELDGKPDEEVLLVISDRDRYRYLVFKQSDNSPSSSRSWRLIFYVDSLYQHYQPPQHRIVTDTKASWLVIRQLTDRGTGISRYEEAWYNTHQRQGELVLTYAVGGRDCNLTLDPCRRFASRVLSQARVNDIYTVEVEFTVDYTSAQFSKTQRAFYVLDSGTGKFFLDGGKSNISKREIEDVYNCSSLSNEEFLSYNQDELLKVAKTGSVEAKEWLKEFLIHSKNTPQKEAISRALK